MHIILYVSHMIIVVMNAWGILQTFFSSKRITKLYWEIRIRNDLN